jgi:UDP-galactopyranose mutase
MSWRCLVLEKRLHIAGNCFDFSDASGLLLHRYGPHCFRTWNASLVHYLGAYTEWIPGNHRVQALHQGRLYPIPVNLTTLELFFGRSLTEDGARALLEEKRQDIKEPKNSEELVLSKVGRELYEAFFRGYTQKQWGLDPRDLDASVCGRIPVRSSRDDRYVDETYQLMPKDGFSALFRRMLQHPLIEVRLGCDYFEVREQQKATIATVYTGPVDAYFNYCYGPLPYRSLDFQWIRLNKEWEQPCVTINYPSDYDYTRSVEIKHVTGQKHPQTMIVWEYPRSQGEPFYPIPAVKNHKLYERYKKLAKTEEEESGVYFCGRLATYSYLNIDTAIELALELFSTIKRTGYRHYAMDRCSRL